MHRVSFARVVVVTIALFSTIVGSASADRAFTARYSTNDTGQIVGIANSLMTCPATASGCTAARGAAASTVTNGALDNNAYAMTYIDVDSDSTTFDSSSATLALPSGSSILFAGLYWAGDYSGTGTSAAPNSGARNTVKFKAPGATAYTTLTATTLDDSTANVGRYQAFRDVTALVAGAGNGAYTVADVQAGKGSDHYAGWSLIIAYKNAAEPARNLTVFDGLKTITTTAGPTDIPVSGFLTPPAGSVKTDIGFVAYEGDNGIVGDSAALNGTVLADAQHPATNFFDSHISTDGVNFTAKNPNDANQQGFDMAFVNADGILANSATSATIRVTTAGDQYLPGVITFATEIYAPKLAQTKTVTDDNGGLVEEGDVLTYTISGTNNGQDGTSGFVLRDPIPANVDYVAGSLRVGAAGTTTAAVTDAASDDLGEYVAASSQVVARLGTGATATAGGNVRPAASYAVSFKVKVHGPATNPVPNGTTVDNTATATYSTQTTGTPLTTSSSVSTTIRSPDLQLTKTRTGPAPVAGSTTQYTLAVANVGGAPTQGTVTVSDPLPAGVTVESISATGWTCTTPPTTSVTCTRSSVLAAGASYPSIVLNVRLGSGVDGSLANTGTVSGGGDGDLSNNTSKDTSPSTRSTDLALTKTASAASIKIGDTVTFTLTARNNGPSDATSVAISDPLPSGLSYVSSTPSCVIAPASGVVTCAIGSLASGASQSVTITARAMTEAGATTQVNTATVGGAQTDPTSANNTASASVAVSGADLLVTKTSSTPEPVRNGNTVTYVVTVRNQGLSAATGVVLTDVLPAALTGVTTDRASVCTIASGTIRCAAGALASGASFAVTVTGRASSPSGELVNRASAVGNEPDPDLSNNDAEVAKNSAPTADLSIAKAVSAATVGTGDTLTFTLTATNQGPDTATSTVITDVLPAGLSFVSAGSGCTYAAATRTVTCAVGTLANAASTSRTITTTVLGTAPAGVLSNVARISSAVFDDDASDDQAQAVTTVVRRADLVAGKTASRASASTGDTVSFTLTARNAGPDDATGVALSDVLPAGLTFVSAADCTYAAASRTVSCPVGALAAGSTATRTVVTTVDAGAPASIANTVTASATSDDPAPANDSATATVATARKADIAITKSAPSGPVSSGDTVAYGLLVKNNGPDVATGVVVSDTLPAAVSFTSAPGCTYAASSRTVTCSVASLAVGASQAFTVSATVLPDPPATIANTATATAAENDPNPFDNTSTVSTTTSRLADVVLDKSAPAGPLTTGASLRYTLAVTNAGPDTAAAVTVADTLPAGVAYAASSAGCTYDAATRTVRCDAGSLAAGAGRTFTIDATVLTSAPDAITNTASASSATTDRTPANNTDSATTATAKRADLVAGKTASRASASTGDTVSFTLTARNAGPDDATGVALSDVLPAGLTFVSAADCTYAAASRTVSCPVGALANGSTATRTVVTTVDAGAPASVVNTVTASAATTDPTPGNDSATATVAVARKADLAVTKTAPAGPVSTGDTVAYGLTVRNAGPDTATSVLVSDTLPTAVTYVSAPGCTYAAATRTVSCTVASLAAGADRLFTVTTTVAPDPPASIANTATATATENDPNPFDNSSTATTSATRVADLVLDKSAPAGPLTTGAALRYTLDVRNTGPDTATGVLARDTLPAGVSYSGSSAGCSYDGTAKQVTCDAGTLAAGAGRSFTIDTVVLPTAPDTITNTATVSSATADRTPGNDSDQATTAVAKSADVGIVKSAPAGPIGTGDTLAYTLKATNGGPDAAADVVLTDALPDGVTYVEAGDADCTYAAATRTVTCAVGTLAGGASVTRTITTKVAADAGASVSNTATVRSSTPDPQPADNTSTASTAIVKRAGLRITKTAPAGPKFAGDTIAYTLAVANDGPDSAQGVLATDVLPTGVRYESASSGCTYDAATRTVSCAIGTLADGATATRTITTTLLADAPATVANTATVTATTTDPDRGDNSSTATTTTGARADLAIDKSAPAGPIGAGEALTYTLDVTNRGSDTATDVVVTDRLPDGIAFGSASGCTYDAATRTVTCTLASIAPGATRTFTIRTTVGASAAGAVTNTASVTAATTDPTPGNNSDDATTAVAADADVAIVKTADNPAPAPGQTVTYTLKATNNGPARATSVVVSDTLPAGVTFASADAGCTRAGTTVTCAAGDLANGESRTFSVKVTVDPLAGAGDPNATHNIYTSKLEQQVDLDAGQTRTVSVTCSNGVMTDGSFRIDAVDQGTGTLADVHAVASRQTDDRTWSITLRNDARGRAQAKLFGVCVTPDAHPIVLSAPVTVTQVLAAGTHTVALPCGTGQHAIAPGFSLDGGDARVRRSEDDGTGWSFTVDVPVATTATFSVRCMGDRLGMVDGHTHALRLSHPVATATIPAGQVAEVQVTCADDAKGIVATSDLPAGLVDLGNDPRPKTRAFRIYNPTSGPLEATVDLLCLGDRTGGESGASRRIDNTASVTATSPDSRTADNQSTARIDVGGA